MNTTPHLRPMEFGDILDGAFKLYRAQFVRMFSAALIAYLPNLAFELWAARAFDVTEAGASAAVGVLRLPILLLTFVLVYATLTYQADRALAGSPVGAGEAFRGAAGRLLPLAAAYALVGLAVGLGLILLIVPGIILAMMFFAVAPAVVVEHQGPMAALSRSRQLSRGALGHIAGVLIVAGIIAMLPTFAVSTAGAVMVGLSAASGGDPTGAMMAMSGLQVLVSALVAPFSVGVMMMLYYDRRVRTEALDLQVAAERLGEPVGV